MTNSLYIAASVAPGEALGMDKVYLAYVAGAIRTRRVFDIVELLAEYADIFPDVDGAGDEVGLRSYVAGFVSNEAARLVSEVPVGSKIEVVNGSADVFADVPNIVPVHDVIVREVQGSLDDLVRKDLN